MITFASLWTVFGACTRHTAPPADLTRIPESLDGLAGRQVRVAGVRLDLGALLGLELTLERGGFVFIPCRVEGSGPHTFGLGADWWMEAWFDGQPLVSTLSRGNGEWPPSLDNFPQAVTAEPGEHLLVVRVLGGGSSCVLCAGNPPRPQMVDGYLCPEPGESGAVVTVVHHGIPFLVRRDGPLTCEAENTFRFANEPLQALFLLGMTTKRPEGSEWWGGAERWHHTQTRVFLGDPLGQVAVTYDDGTGDTFPLICGVNAWFYELFEHPKPYEKGLNTYWGPYREPFDSCSDARQALADSLRLHGTGGQKTERYVLALRLDGRRVNHVQLQPASGVGCNVIVSAATGLPVGAPVPALPLLDLDFFLRHDYQLALDRLARRLYQFRDELPPACPVETPAGYDGPDVRFLGGGDAALFTNVYRVNLHDVRANKVTADGRPHTSSRDAPSFGSYVGFGTFAPERGQYWSHMWTRDVGRELIETVWSGETERVARAAEVLAKYLYEPGSRHPHPNWKRVANASELGEGVLRGMAGKENDGHAAVMLFYAAGFVRRALPLAWWQEHARVLRDAMGWFIWQVEHPDHSRFDRVLHSESEASRQKSGGYDRFSNALAIAALDGCTPIAEAIGDVALARRGREVADLLRRGLNERFTGHHARHGEIWTDTIEDCWTIEYKRFAELFVLPDLRGYDVAAMDPELERRARATWLAQKEDYFNPASGRQMGYCQGYLTQSAILLDEFADLTACLHWATAFCYHHSDVNWIVPEGVICHPSGRFWFRNGDLGNAVQQGEIVKCGRLLLGLDDCAPVEGLKLIPRLPDGWQGLQAYGAVVMAVDASGCVGRHTVDFDYVRDGTRGYRLRLRGPRPMRIAACRLGPFERGTAQVKVTGATQYRLVERGDRCFAEVTIDACRTTLEITATV
jgi:hypothetical protein